RGREACSSPTFRQRLRLTTSSPENLQQDNHSNSGRENLLSAEFLFIVIILDITTTHRISVMVLAHLKSGMFLSASVHSSAGPSRGGPGRGERWRAFRRVARARLASHWNSQLTLQVERFSARDRDFELFFFCLLHCMLPIRVCSRTFFNIMQPYVMYRLYITIPGKDRQRLKSQMHDISVSFTTLKSVSVLLILTCFHCKNIYDKPSSFFESNRAVDLSYSVDVTTNVNGRLPLEVSNSVVVLHARTEYERSTVRFLKFYL
ncbi:hypothetical protein L9F63_001573, partial [Diploptera punctata]